MTKELVSDHPIPIVVITDKLLLLYPTCQWLFTFKNHEVLTEKFSCAF